MKTEAGVGRAAERQGAGALREGMVRCPMSRLSARLRGRAVWAFALLLSLPLWVALPLRAQTVTVKNWQKSVVDIVHINPDNPDHDWPMPQVYVDFSGLLCGDKVTTYISMNWQDSVTGKQTHWDSPTQTFTVSGSSGTAEVVFQGTESAWNLATYEHTNDESEGGHALVNWTLNGVTQFSYSFSIMGNEDPSSSKTAVDNFYKNSLSVPWFWGNILEKESSGRQYAATPGYPLVVSNPDGIGMAQVDGTQNPVNDYVYWNFEGNIEKGLAVLNAAKSDAEGDWPIQFQDSNWTYPISGNAPLDYYDPGGTMECSFSANLQGPSYGNWGDADWIQSYNTGYGSPSSGDKYFLWWVYGAGWAFRYQYSTEPNKMAGYNYVPSVCTSTPY